MVLLLTILFLSFASMFLIVSQIFPILTDKFHRIQSKKVSQAEKQLDEMFVSVNRKKLFLYYTLSPLVLAGLAFFLFNQPVFALAGGVVGFALPALIIRIM